MAESKKKQSKKLGIDEIPYKEYSDYNETSRKIIVASNMKSL